jgi:hypothetical protein
MENHHLMMDIPSIYPPVNIQKTMENHHTKNHGKSPFFFMGKSTLNYHVFHSFVELPEGNMTGMDSVDGK